MTQDIINKFKEKQGFKNVKQIDDRVWAMDGFYFDIDDIKFDVEKEITPGRIKLYASEGRDNGKLPSYSKWIAEWDAY